MAAKRSIFLSLILTNIVISLCQSEVVHIRNIDDIKADMLLRGSAERHEDIDDELPVTINRDINKEIINRNEETINRQEETINQDEATINREEETINRNINRNYNRDIEPERSLRQLDEQNEKAIENSQDTIQITEKDDATKANMDLKTTTDNVQINTNTNSLTEVVPEPEPLSLKDNDNDSSDESREVDDYYTTVLSTDLADSTTDVNKANSVSGFVDDEESVKPEQTPPITTTKSTESSRIADEFEPAAVGHPVAVPPGVSSFDDERDFSQRVPKADNVEPRIQDKRNFETYAPAPPKPDPTMKNSETLKRWLEDTWLRPPAGILVPLRPSALTQALAVWNDLTAEGLKVSDVVIIGYDSNGVNWRSRHNLQPTKISKSDKTVAEALSKLILKYQHVDESTNDSTIKALAAASKLVPYDSALFVITDKGPGDSHRIKQAVRALVEKRLRVYTIWTDPNYPSEESEKQLEDLRNISRHTEGDVLPYSMQVMDVEDNSADGPRYDHMKSDRKGKSVYKDQEDTLLVRRGGGEAISLGLPVENGIVSLRIFIEGLVEHAVLYPPNDAPQIDLYNMTSIHAFSPNSHMAGMSPRDVYLVFPGASADYDTQQVIPAAALPLSQEPSAPTVGVWHLSVRCDTCDYRLCVTARSQIHVSVSEDKDKLKIRVLGPVSSIRESMLVDEYGTELAKLPFSYHPVATDGKEMPEASASTEINSEVPLPAVKGSRVYAKIVGRDVRGEPFVRLAGPLNQAVRTSRSASYSSYQDVEVNDLQRAEYSRASNQQRLGYNETSIVPNNRAGSVVVNQVGSLQTSVQIGLSSRLYGAPGDNLQLYFEVTNYRDQSVRFTFEAVGELRFLRGISPTNQAIGAGQTANVIVSVGITTSAQPGARDFITFTASSYGYDTVSISAYVYVTNVGETSTDVWSPELRHIFQGTCIGRQGNDCSQHTWSATVYARDSVSGLLRLASTPVGIMYDSNFVSGTREQVIGTYRATCCNPRVVVTAVDALGNANSYVVDISTFYNNDQGIKYPTSYDIIEEIAEEIDGLSKASNQLDYIGEAGIAAIVLGVLLLIALIALVVFLVYLCVKRRQESRELPYTATTRRDLK